MLGEDTGRCFFTLKNRAMPTVVNPMLQKSQQKYDPKLISVQVMSGWEYALLGEPLGMMPGA